MRRLCERPGCAGAAEVSYGIDHGTLVVWVDNKAESERGHAGRLCRRHANALSVPRGWSIDDRRELIPKLFVVPSTTDEKPSPGKKKETISKRPRIKLDRPRPSLFEKNDEMLSSVDEERTLPASEEVEKTSVVEDQIAQSIPESEQAQVLQADEHVEDPDETQAIPWSPRLSVVPNPEDESQEEEKQPVFGRLLGRAFGQRASEE